MEAEASHDAALLSWTGVLCRYIHLLQVAKPTSLELASGADEAVSCSGCLQYSYQEPCLFLGRTRTGERMRWLAEVWRCTCVTMCKNPSVESSLQSNTRKNGKFHGVLFSCTVELKVRKKRSLKKKSISSTKKLSTVRAQAMEKACSRARPCYITPLWALKLLCWHGYSHTGLTGLGRSVGRTSIGSISPGDLIWMVKAGKIYRVGKGEMETWVFYLNAEGENKATTFEDPSIPFLPAKGLHAGAHLWSAFWEGGCESNLNCWHQAALYNFYQLFWYEIDKKKFWTWVRFRGFQYPLLCFLPVLSR